MKIDRRAILAGAVGTTAAAMVGRSLAQQPARIRYNVASAPGQRMLATYAKGVALMKALPAKDPKSWLFSWYTHWTPQKKATLLQQTFGSDQGAAYQLANAAWSTCQPHAHTAGTEPFFVFWHRLYVMYLEQMIAGVTGTPAFTLPYWDYTTPANAALPTQFRMPNDPTWGTLYQANRNVAGNGNANVNAGDPIDKYSPGALSLAALGDADFLTFDQDLDQGLHGNVHGLVGNTTNMGFVPTAAGDPVFWLHHANIDRIWYAWAANGGANPTTYANTFTFTNADGTAATAALNSVAQNGALTYGYDTLPAAFNAAATPAPAPTTPRSPQLLLSSAPRAGRKMTAAAPIVLGARPLIIPLQPVDPAKSLTAAVRTLGRSNRIRLVIKGVQAAAPPGTLFGVYLNLPSGVAPGTPASAAYRVGYLNFFGVTAVPDMMAMPRDYAFDVTPTARQLSTTNKLAAASAVTIAPAGAPAANSAPTISGTVEVELR